MPPTPPTLPSPPAIPVAPLTGSEWLAARASLAWRRAGRFMRIWLAILGPLALIALGLAFTERQRDGAGAMRERLAADTVRTAEALRRAERASATAESTFIAAATPVRASPAVPRVAAAPRLVPGAGAPPMLRSLESAIAEARRLRTPSAWLAVADEPAVRGGPRMRALADSLSARAQERDALPSGPDRDELAAPLTRTINRLGYVIIAIAENRREELAAAAGVAPAPAAELPVDASTTGAAPPAAVTADTAALAASARAERDTLASAQRAHAEAVDAFRAQGAVSAGTSTGLAAAMPAIAFLALLVLGLAIRYGSALSQEMKAATIAHVDEAQRTIGLPVVAAVRDGLLDGPARFRPSGVDPFRMLYLGLTSTGTRARTAIVTGDDPVLVAAVGARLAISAAADHRTTLVVDADPSSIALSRIFRERAEPGLSDALAGAFGWREVARPLGSSDGLPITLLPAGTERDEPARDTAFDAHRDALTRFRASYEFTILVAPGAHLERAVALVESSPVILTASAGETLLARFAELGAQLKSAGHRLYGTVLWDAPRPALPSRAELAALLSKQKGRTPGGSFAAVRKAIGGEDKGSKKPS